MGVIIITIIEHHGTVFGILFLNLQILCEAPQYFPVK